MIHNSFTSETVLFSYFALLGPPRALWFYFVYILLLLLASPWPVLAYSGLLGPPGTLLGSWGWSGASWRSPGCPGASWASPGASWGVKMRECRNPQSSFIQDKHQIILIHKKLCSPQTSDRPQRAVTCNLTNEKWYIFSKIFFLSNLSKLV